jgi:two-component system sensor histidine kinase RegB
MFLPPLIRPHVYAYPTLDTAIWFLQLRWLAVFGQLITLLVVHFGLSIELPLGKICLLIGVTVGTNLAYWYWLARLHRSGMQTTDRLPTDQVITALMLIDILDLTGLLYLTAGIANPFGLFYFVNVAMAAAIITPQWAWMLWACTIACIILLVSIQAHPIQVIGLPFTEGDQDTRWTIPKLGYLISFMACSGIITHFITILTGELRQREHLMKEVEEAKSRNRQLESLATLAGGAAHELASPLSTIAVVAKELGRSLEKSSVPNSVMNDVSLIRSELDRCRQILDRMTTATGEAAGERLRDIGVEEFLEETLLGVRDVHRVHIECHAAARGATTLLPVQAVAQAVRNLVQNALDASHEDSKVHVLASLRDNAWFLEIVDQGQGMPEEVIKRLGEPFFTTKEPGKGMGLGVYLAANVMRNLGGKLSFVSQPGQGTTAQVWIPLQR